MHRADPTEINKGTRPESGYETRDIHVGPIAKYTFWFFVCSTIAIFAVVPLYLWFLAMRGGAPGHQPLALPPPPPPNPPLQSHFTAKTDIVNLRIHEKKALESYGWVDRSKGIVHIPIERAIALTVERGLNPQGERANP